MRYLAVLYFSICLLAFKGRIPFPIVSHMPRGVLCLYLKPFVRRYSKPCGGG